MEEIEETGVDHTYVKRLELTLKRMNREKQEMEHLIADLRAQCKKHYDAVQHLMRYELKIDSSKERTATGVVHGTNEKFTVPL